MGTQSQKLPPELIIELLHHMSEEGRFEQTLSEFPNFNLRQIRETFAWLADSMRRQVKEEETADVDFSLHDLIAQICREKEVSPKTREVLNQLPPEQGRKLLRNFGALD